MRRYQKLVLATIVAGAMVAAAAGPSAARWAKRNSTDFSWVDEQVRACPKGFVYGRAINGTDPGAGATGSTNVNGIIAVAVPGSPPEGTQVLNSTMPLVRNPIKLEVDPGIFQTRWLSGTKYYAWTVNGSPVTLPEGTSVQITSGNDFQFVSVGDCTQGDIPFASVRGATMAEGDAGSRMMVFNVSLSRRPSLPVTVQWRTVNGTATVADNDYTAKTGTMTFAPGDSTRVVNVPVTPDTRTEPNETFAVELTAATNAVIATPSATATIRNDDAPSATAVLRISDTQCPAGYMGTRVCRLQVTLSKPRTAATSVQWRTVDGTAKKEAPGFDYFTQTGTVSIPAGAVAAAVNVTVTSNYTEIEPAEQFYVDLFSPVGATINDTRGVVKVEAP